MRSVVPNAILSGKWTVEDDVEVYKVDKLKAPMLGVADLTPKQHLLTTTL